MVKPTQQDEVHNKRQFEEKLRRSPLTIRPQYKCVYLVVCIKLSNEAFPVYKIIVYSVKSCYIYVCQNP